MGKMVYALAWVLVGLMLLAGCAVNTGHFQADFGTSFELAKSNQTINPGAEKNLNPVSGLDGQIVQTITEKYRQGFEKTKATPTYTFSIGDTGGNK